MEFHRHNILKHTDGSLRFKKLLETITSDNEAYNKWVKQLRAAAKLGRQADYCESNITT